MGYSPFLCIPLTLYQTTMSKRFPKRQIVDSSKLKEFADDNFEFDENGEKFSKWIENTVWKRKNCSLRATSPFSSVFKIIILQTHKNKGLFEKGLRLIQIESFSMEQFVDSSNNEIAI